MRLGGMKRTREDFEIEVLALRRVILGNKHPDTGLRAWLIAGGDLPYTWSGMKRPRRFRLKC